MGVPHLEELRTFMKELKEESFSKTYLRAALRQNFPQINQNLDYLIKQDGVVVQFEKEGKVVYQWKENDTNVTRKKDKSVNT